MMTPLFVMCVEPAGFSEMHGFLPGESLWTEEPGGLQSMGFFVIVLLWDWNENLSFPVLWPLLSFPNLLAY